MDNKSKSPLSVWVREDQVAELKVLLTHGFRSQLYELITDLILDKLKSPDRDAFISKIISKKYKLDELFQKEGDDKGGHKQ